jgi:hypothetical protein
MIIILSPTAQLASDTLRLDPPPSLSVGAEYGAFVLEGTEYTSAHNQPLGSPYVGRHITPFGKPAPCNDTKIPKLQDSEVALVSKIDISTLGGLLRASDKFNDNGTFWFYVEHIEAHGIHKAKKDHPCWILYNGILAWIKENKPEIDEKRNNDITDFCYEAFDFIIEALKDGQVASSMGNALISSQEKLDEISFVSQEPSGMVIRRTRGQKVNHLYREGIAVISYDEKYKAITISISEPIHNFSCHRLVQEWWGDRATGTDLQANSAKGKIMSEDDFRKSIEKFDMSLIKTF